jgi:acetyl esterase/lipase
MKWYAKFTLGLPILFFAACTKMMGTLQPEITKNTPLSGSETMSTNAKQPVLSFKHGSITRDITYCTADGFPQKLDIYYPSTPSSKPLPVVLYIHGGAWLEGDKDSDFFFPLMKDLQEDGFLVAAVNYRLAPRHPFPAQIEDARCAIRFMRAHAMDFNLDPEKIGVFGDSAGGHLVSLIGLAESNTAWDAGEYLSESSRVQAVVDLYGISDISKVFGHDEFEIWPQVFLTRDENDPILKKASPLTYVHASTPPFLIIHGNRDQVVPFEQSQWLYDAMKVYGNSVELIEVKNADHQFVQVGESLVEPEVPEIFRIIVNFFKLHLK